jgi:negative regulator of flagellin synthesis FlgM
VFPESSQPQKTQKSGASSNQRNLTPTRSSQDQTQLSVDSQRLEQLQASLSQLPEIRQDRVAALREAVANGSHQVSDQQLAGAIHSQLVTGKAGSEG